MEAPDFWDNAEVSQKKMKDLKSMKDDMETYQNLVTQKEDMETLIEMSYEENDPSMIEEIQEMLDEFQAQFDSIRVKTLLSGEYDGENAIIKLNAGAGGTEACDWCSMLYRMYQRWADKKGFTTEVLDFLDGCLIHHQLPYILRDHNQFMDRHPSPITGMAANITAFAEGDRVDRLMAPFEDFPFNRGCRSCIGTIFADGFDKPLRDDTAQSGDDQIRFDAHIQ